MECTIAALIACFSWSNLYIDAQVEYQDARYEERIETFTHEEVLYGFGVRTVTNSETTISASHKAANPYMRNAIGYELQFRNLKLALEAFHDSSMATEKDRGVNGIALRARWFPFRRR